MKGIMSMLALAVALGSSSVAMLSTSGSRTSTASLVIARWLSTTPKMAPTRTTSTSFCMGLWLG